MQAELPRSELSGQGEIEVNGNPVSRGKKYDAISSCMVSRVVIDMK